jgi:uncharacterized protein (UPF0248 family)
MNYTCSYQSKQTLFFAFLKRLALMCAIVSFHLISFGQDNLLDKKISIKLSNQNIHNSLDSLAKISDCYFTYNPDLFDGDVNFNLKFQNQKLSSVLRKIIPDTTLSFEQLDRHIIIVPQELKAANTDIKEEMIPYISYRKIQGTITSKNRKDPLPYANVGIRGKHIGTITNLDGKFSLSISSKNIHDTLVISYLGYKNKEIPVAGIKNNEIDIQLNEDFISLQEVIIRNNDPLALVKGAIRNIRHNYPQDASNLTSFYRESVSKNNKYMIYVESIMDIYKAPYIQNNSLDRVKLFKSRKIYDTSRLDTISFRLKGGIQGCLMLDIIKNRPEFLNPEYLHFYDFRLTDISSYNNTAVYVIEFKPKANLENPLLTGRLLIETESLAIIQGQFGYESNRLHEIKNRFISKGNAKTKVRPQTVEYMVSYKNIGGKYYFNHVAGNLKFKVKNRKKFFANTFATNFEMATTKIDTIHRKRFRYRETIHPKVVMSKESFTYDPGFWGPQNIIKPEEKIEEALERIQNSLEQVAMEDVLNK